MKISIVLLNYGDHDFVFQSLRSLGAMNKSEECELIFVDNGSTEAEWARMNKRMREDGYRIDKIIRLTVNQGFAVGMNTGADAAQGDWVVMLNSDTIVGNRFLEQICTAHEKVQGANVGFLALPVYDWRYSATESVLTNSWQADVAALTSYISCMPVRFSEINPRFILGPPGPVVIMSSAAIRTLKKVYGCVYDPHFFMYGEDVDLFLRVKRLGFRTFFMPGKPDRGEVIWHIGSGTTGGPDAAMRTIDKDPATVRRILDGMVDNAISHSGWMELVPLMLLHSFFRLSFYVLYASKKSPSALWELLRRPRDHRPAPLMRKHPRAFGLWLSRYIAVGRHRPMPWARRTVRLDEDQAEDYVSSNVS